MNTKMQTTAWEIIFVKHIPYKGLIRLHKKKLLQHNSKNTSKLLHQLLIQIANKIMKKGSTLLVIRKHKLKSH